MSINRKLSKIMSLEWKRAAVLSLPKSQPKLKCDHPALDPNWTAIREFHTYKLLSHEPKYVIEYFYYIVQFSYKTMSGSSQYRFGVLAKIVKHMRTRHQDGDDHPLTIEDILDETNQLDIGSSVKAVSIVTIVM